MNTINALFNNYGWRQISNSSTNQYIYIKNNENRLDEYTIVHASDAYTITIPLINSIYSYKNTISNITDVKTYLELHLGGQQ